MKLHQLFHRAASVYRSRPAIIRGSAPAMTFETLNRRVCALAGWLRHGLGLQQGARVAQVMKNCPQYIETTLAAWRAGLCVVPINSKLHVKELAYVLRHSEASACFTTDDHYGELLANSAPELHQIDVNSREYNQALEHPASDSCEDHVDLAWLFYTSGTTGRPKGVMLTHENLHAMALNFFASIQSVDASEAIAHVAPLSHGSGMLAIPYWIRGAVQIIPESGGFDETELFDLLDRYSGVSLFAAPTIVRRMARYATVNQRTTSGLRTVFVGGAPFYLEDIKSAVSCLGPRVAQIYGQGESPMSITALSANQIAMAIADGDDAMLQSVGVALPSLDVAILDDVGNRACAGTLGEVVVRGPTVMKGYLNDPGATNQALADGWLHTGDVGVMDNRGLLQLKDRSKDIIISGGANIYPREVEEVLLTHPAVHEVAVVGRYDPEWGEVVVAFVVGKGVSEEELDALCLENIARFKRPKEYRFVEGLPKNNYGKVLKTELRSKF